MKFVLMAFGVGVMAAGVGEARAQDPAATPSTCFTVIEARAGVPPGAPILVDRCSGETFILTRTQNRIEWVPIAKNPNGRPEAKTMAKAPTGSKTGCFSYNDRTYCP